MKRAPSLFELGPLEEHLMQILWDHGEACVRDVVSQLGRPLAYTTVMTTLDRLFKKGLLNRRRSERAFAYSPRLTKQEWKQAQGESLAAGFLSSPALPSDLLISCLVDAVSAQDVGLLDELERRIQTKRMELIARRKL